MQSQCVILCFTTLFFILDVFPSTNAQSSTTTSVPSIASTTTATEGNATTSVPSIASTTTATEGNGSNQTTTSLPTTLLPASSTFAAVTTSTANASVTSTTFYGTPTSTTLTNTKASVAPTTSSTTTTTSASTTSSNELWDKLIMNYLGGTFISSIVLVAVVGLCLILLIALICTCHQYRKLKKKTQFPKDLIINNDSAWINSHDDLLMWERNLRATEVVPANGPSHPGNEKRL